MWGMKIGDTATKNEYKSCTSACVRMSKGQARSGGATANSLCPVSVTRQIAADIPGANLSEPWESHAAATLRWWLLCRGMKPPTRWRKKQSYTRWRKKQLIRRPIKFALISKGAHWSIVDGHVFV